MKKTYQPFIIKMANQIVNDIENNTSFFFDENITSRDFSIEILCDILTEKFLNGEISSDEDDLTGIFTETEFVKILHRITIQNALNGLKDKGLVNSFEDDGEEHYFLTENGKKLAKNMKKENGDN